MNGKHTKQYIIGNDHIHIHNRRYQPNTLINQSINHLSTINQHIHYFSISQLIHLENTIYLLVTQKFFVAKNMWQYCKLPHMKYRFMYVYICIDNVLCLNETKQNLISEYWIFNATFRLRYSYCTQDRFSMEKNEYFLINCKDEWTRECKGCSKNTAHRYFLHSVKHSRNVQWLPRCVIL